MSTTNWRDEPVPTHRCTMCNALWRFWPTRDTGRPDSWNLRSKNAGPCCDNWRMAEQIVPLELGVLSQWLAARIAVETFEALSFVDSLRKKP